MADYGCFPLWRGGEEIGNVDPNDLPLTQELKSALRLWADSYDKILNQECPLDSGFSSLAEEEAFQLEGKRLHGALQEQLGAEYRIILFEGPWA